MKKICFSLIIILSLGAKAQTSGETALDHFNNGRWQEAVDAYSKHLKKMNRIP